MRLTGQADFRYLWPMTKMTKNHTASPAHLRTSLGARLSEDQIAEMEAARDALPTVAANFDPNDNPVKVYVRVYEDLMTRGVFFTQPTLGVVRELGVERPSRYLGDAVVAAAALKGHLGDPARPDLIVNLLPLA